MVTARSSSVDPNGNADTPEIEILHPTPRKTSVGHALRSKPSKGGLQAGNGDDARRASDSSRYEMVLHHVNYAVSNQYSGRSTPVPPDAPPSTKSLATVRQQRRSNEKRRKFPTIDYEPRVSHFHPNSEYHDFRGFFVLFWIGNDILALTAILRNLKDTGYPFVWKQWPLFLENIYELAPSDVAMFASTAVSLPLQWLFVNNKAFRWHYMGMAIQTIYELVWLSFWIQWPFMRSWTWTAQVFFTLHILVEFMKMHSYAFYNGHLSEMRRRLLEHDDPRKHAMLMARRPSVDHYPKIKSEPGNISDKKTMNGNEKQETSSLDIRTDLAEELTSPLGNISYPSNLTVNNYIDYLFCPTLCYEIEYPRVEERNYHEMFWKGLAVFGCIFLMTTTTEEFVLPVLDEASTRLAVLNRRSGHLTPNAKRMEEGLVLAEAISRLLFPFMVIFLLVFLSIFEYSLNFFAEVTKFADRQFYSDWWNSCDWLEFSREWNIPVHNFLNRHVYRASRPYMGKWFATMVTFLISAAMHELVMACITKKLRGYGAFALMLQIPFVAIQRTKFFKNKPLFNVSFRDIISEHID